MDERGRVLIVGGGVGGLALGTLLQRQGVLFEVWERETAARAPGAGLGLSGPTIRFLASIGLDLRDPDLSTPVLRIDLRTRAGRRLKRFDPGRDRPSGVGPRALRRAALLRLLEQGIPSGCLIRGHRVTSFREERSSVVIRTERDAESAPGEVIVGADGVRSTVRGWLGRSLGEARYTGYTAWQAMVRGTVPDPGTSTLAIGSGSEFGYVQAGKGDVYWYATLRSAHPPARGDDPLPVLRAAFRDWNHPAKELIDATPVEQIAVNPVHSLRPFPHWSAGRLTLLGDAAHPMTPHLGQGATLAIEDAAELSRVFSSPHFTPADLERYSRRRYPRTRAMMVESARLGRILHWANPLSVFLRDWMISMLPHGYYGRRSRRVFESSTL